MFKYHMFCSSNISPDHVQEYVIRSGYAIKDATRAFTYQIINEIKTQTIIYDITFRINPINNCYTGYISCSNREFAIWARHYNDLAENLSENNIPKEYANFAKTLTNDKIFYDDIAEELDKMESPSPKQLIEP